MIQGELESRIGGRSTSSNPSEERVGQAAEQRAKPNHELPYRRLHVG